MEPASAPPRTLSTAEQRREELILAAVRVFARLGYGAPTTAIAEEAGISQAYLFRLFPSKDELFAAASRETSRRMKETFSAAAAAAKQSGEDPLQAMGHAYGELLEQDRDTLLVQLHTQVVAGHSDLAREALRSCFRDLYELVKNESEADADELRGWFAHGMLCNVMASIDADHSDEEWARVLAGDKEDCG